VALFDSHSESRQALEHLLLRFCDTLESCDDLPELAPETLAMTPDLVVFSVVPLASAEEVTRQLTQLRSYHHTPILMISPLSNALLPLKNLASDTLTPLIVIDRPATYNALGEVFSGKEVGPPNSQQLPALNARVLAAEDNEFARILLTALLERAGIEYRTVCNGAEAIAACKEQPFDLIMLDVHMPETTGIEALKEIRNYPNPNQRTPIIMLTADILQQEENLLFAAGANDLVFNPIDETKLFTILQQHLNRAGLGGGQTKPPVSASLPENHRDRFVQEVTALAAAINKAVNDYDTLQLRDSLHQLLGIAGVFRIHSLERAVSELHSAVKAENEEKTYAALETLMHEVATLSTPPSAGHKQPA
jgi:two-component system sensor histidine kinase BarA